MAFKLKTLSAILITLLITSSVYAKTNWFHQNPYPTAEDLNDIFVFDEKTAIAVGDFGTVLKTTDGGLNWKTSHKTADATEDLNSVYFITENVGWTVGFSWDLKRSIVLKTEDKGDSWELACFDIPCELYSIFFIDTKIGFACGSVLYESENEVNLFKSINGGATWDPIDINSEETLFDIFFINSSTGWMGSDNGVILKTIDGGNSWEPKNVGIDGVVASICFINENIGYIKGGDDILVTLDGGDNWSTLDPGLFWGEYVYSLHFLNEDEGWILSRTTSSNYILKTINGGDSWNKVEWEGWEKSADVQKDYLSSIQFSDYNHGWIVGEAGTILKSNDGGEIWMNQFDGTNNLLNNVCFIDFQTGWAGGGGGLIFKTTNGGGTWTKLDSMTWRDIDYLKFFDKKNGLILCGTSVYNTDDGGITWKQQTTNKYNEISTAFFITPEIGYVAGSENSWSGTSAYILKTIDNGKTWDEKWSLSTTSNIDFTDIQFFDENNGIVLEAGRMYKTTDGGGTWERKYTPSHSCTALHFLDQKTGWVVGYGNSLENGAGYVSRISKTTDGGDTWEDQNCGDNPWLYSVYFVDGNIGLAAGEDGIVLETIDGGATWTSQKISSKTFYDISVYNSEKIWIVGEDGIIKHSQNLSTRIEESETNQNKSDFVLFQNYPNPFNPSTTISFSIKKQSNVKIEIYNLLGQKIRTLLNTTLTQGFHKLNWDGLNEAGMKLDTGVYIYRIITNEYIESKKMLLIK